MTVPRAPTGCAHQLKIMKDKKQGKTYLELHAGFLMALELRQLESHLNPKF